jgi:DNA-binding MarR family transcriptional regulator
MAIPERMAMGLLLRRSHAKAAAALNGALEPLGLTGRHFGVLLLLAQVETSTQRDLIRRTGSDKAGMARTIADLREQGLIDLETSQADRRVIHLALNDTGRRVFDDARRRASGAATELFARFDDDEIATLTALLGRFVED